MISTIQDIQSDFDKVIAYSQGFKDVNSMELLQQWYKAKEDLIDLWGGKLIIQQDEPVTFDLSQEEKRRRLDDFIYMVEETHNNYGLANFLGNITSDEFFTNHLLNDYYLDVRSEKKTKIPKGTKIVKAFKYFEKNKEVLANLQNQASMIIQEDKVSGILCFSVHPLDFLSSSENTHSWRSCHALDGEYRAGNLSYLLDNSTIICYLKSDEEKHKLPNFPEDVPWNSKKWRMWLFLENNREALFAGRQYPFFSPAALEAVRNFYLHSIAQQRDRVWSGWYSDFITRFPGREGSVSRDRELTNGRNVMLCNKIYPMLELVEDANNSRHFNDLIYSSFYIPYYCWSYFPETNEPLKFNIGSPVPCLRCGKNHVDLDASMICLNCDAEVGTGENDYFTYCACCERRVPRDQACWLDSIDDYLCPECYDKETTSCDRCGENWYTCELQFSREAEEYLCPWCREAENRRRYLPF